MFYESVKVRAGETVSKLAAAYGYKASDWKKIWNDPKNASLATNRGKPERLQVGDTLHVRIPWTVNSKVIVPKANGVKLTVRRSGGRGTRLRWVQTVNRDNQPFGAPDQFCTDPCGPPDDNQPFYYTAAELTAGPSRRKEFFDGPQRPAPSAAKGTTTWRAVLSIAVVTDKRVAVFDSWVWGFDITPAGVVAKATPRRATQAEIHGHLNLLRKGKGTAGTTFKSAGWVFRQEK